MRRLMQVTAYGSCADTAEDCADYACVDGGNGLWLADGYCDAINNIPSDWDAVITVISTDTYDLKHGVVMELFNDPDSADLAEGGQCNEYSSGCTDPYADNYDPDATEDDGLAYMVVVLLKY